MASSIPITPDTPLSQMPFADKTRYAAKAQTNGTNKITLFRMANRRNHRMPFNGFVAPLNVGW